MRLPNGFGSVHKLPGKRRKPWRARVTTGWVMVDKDGQTVPDDSRDAVDAKQVYKTIGYFGKRQEALAALMAYNGEEPEQAALTFAELYDKWIEMKTPTLSEGSLKAYRSDRKRLAGLDEVPIDKLAVDGLDRYFRELDCTPGGRQKSAALCQQVLRYAYKKGYTTTDLAGRMDHYTQPAPTIVRKVFTGEEVATLWASDRPAAKAALVALYGGWRPGEVLAMTPAAVNLQEMTITGGSKTDAGKDRVVPIHSAILPMVRELVASSGPMLFPFSRMTYTRLINELGHTPHDTRHSFATVAKDCGMDPTIRKRILGHAVTDITESVYTHATAERFRAEIEKLHY